MNQNESENNEVPLLYQTKTSYEQNPLKADEYLRQSRPIKNKRNIDFSPRATKGQLILEWSFGVFKSPKKPTKFLTDFLPHEARAYVKKLVDFLGDLKAQKFHSEIKWPLVLIQVKCQNIMQIAGKQSQHQTKGLTLEKVKICLVKKTRKIKVF